MHTRSTTQASNKACRDKLRAGILIFDSNVSICADHTPTKNHPGSALCSADMLTYQAVEKEELRDTAGVCV